MEYSQEQLNDLNFKLKEKIDDVIKLIKIENAYSNEKCIMAKCPIHDGDNRKSLYINKQFGTWKCWTGQCHKTHKSSLIGLVRGYLNKDKYTSFFQTIKFCEDFLGNPIGKLELTDEERELSDYNRLVADGQRPVPAYEIPIDKMRELYVEPSKYYLKRGFTKEILDKYCIQDCNTPGKYFNKRAVIPVIDDGLVIGFTGRSIYEKCDDCGYYHSGVNLCPNEDIRHIYSKWRHSEKFYKENYLFNYHFAKEYISSTTQAILVESPNNVLRLEEAGIHNSVCIFGCYLSNYQKYLLDLAGCLNLIVILDNDKAGLGGQKSILDLCGLTHNICFLTPKTNDIAEMSVSEIKEFLKGHY